MWSMKTLFVLPVIAICAILEAIKLLKNKVSKKEVSEYSVEGK
jgi:hypothetical protein